MTGRIPYSVPGVCLQIHLTNGDHEHMGGGLHFLEPAMRAHRHLQPLLWFIACCLCILTSHRWVTSAPLRQVGGRAAEHLIQQSMAFQDPSAARASKPEACLGSCHELNQGFGYKVANIERRECVISCRPMQPSGLRAKKALRTWQPRFEGLEATAAEESSPEIRG